MASLDLVWPIHLGSEHFERLSQTDRLTHSHELTKQPQSCQAPRTRTPMLSKSRVKPAKTSKSPLDPLAIHLVNRK